MKRKIITYTLLSLFLFSIIGVPISHHYCEMMQQKSISSCEICANEMSNVKSFCCEDEQNNYRETISTPSSNCCQNEFVFNKVDDEFLLNKTELNIITILENVLHIADSFQIVEPLYTQQTLYSDSSPPFLINPDIHISNSALLI